MQKWAAKFYKSDKWIKCRLSYLQERMMIDGGLCEECHEAPGYIMHHKIALNVNNVNDPDIALNRSNLEWVCKDCHDKFEGHGLYQKKKEEKVSDFDESGQPIERRKAHIVCGPPGSGKTTYVKKNMKRGDIVVDLDLIKQAISMSEKLEAPDNLLPVALEIRDLIYSMIEKKRIDCDTCWVIAALPDEWERRELQLRLRADIIEMDADYKTCFDRIMEDDERTDKQKAVQVLERYFRKAPLARSHP